MRKLVLLAAFLGLLAVPAFANDGVMPETKNPPPPPHDRLVQTPMTCMMPPLPSLMLDNSTTPMDIVKLGAARLSDFVQDLAIYMNCLGNKAKIVAAALYERFVNYMRAKAPAKQLNKQDP